MADMSDLTSLCCSPCDADLERLRYYPRQIMLADDMRAEQEYFREKARRHNRYLHGWGVVCGCEVQPLADAANANNWRVRVCPGYAVSPQGDEILINECVDVDLKLGAIDPPCSVRWPCPPTGEMPGTGPNSRQSAYIAVRYAECMTRPLRVQPAGCGCDETACEYSRIRDSFELRVLWELPDSHKQAIADDKAWCDTVGHTAPELLRRLHTYPVPPCPPCVSDPWVVLAQVILTTASSPDTGIAGGPPATSTLEVSYLPRRVLLATQRLQVAALCVP